MSVDPNAQETLVLLSAAEKWLMTSRLPGHEVAAINSATAIQRARAAIEAYLRAITPVGEPVGYVTDEALKLMLAAKPGSGWHYHVFAKDQTDAMATVPIFAPLPAGETEGERAKIIEECAKVADAERLTGTPPYWMGQGGIEIAEATARATAKSIAAAIRALSVEGTDAG